MLAASERVGRPLTAARTPAYGSVTQRQGLPVTDEEAIAQMFPTASADAGAIDKTDPQAAARTGRGVHDGLYPTTANQPE